MPPKNKKGDYKKKKDGSNAETGDSYVSPKNRFQDDKVDFDSEQAATIAHEEEKLHHLEESNTESTHVEDNAAQFEQVSNLESTTRTEEEPRLEVSQGTEVLTSSIQSNWDEMQKNELTNKTLQESVIEPKENLAESTYVPFLTRSQVEVEENLNKVEVPLKTTVIETVPPQVDPTNPFLSRSSEEVQEAFARAEAAAKTQPVETQLPVADDANPFLTRSQAEVQEAFARADFPVTHVNTTTESHIDPLEKSDTHYNPFVALSSPVKEPPKAEEQENKIDPSNFILTRSAVEVQEALARAESPTKAATTTNEGTQESWIVVGDKHTEKPVEVKVAESEVKIQEPVVVIKPAEVKVSEMKVRIEEPIVVSKPASLTHDERLKKAADQIASAKSLKEENKPDRAVTLLSSSLDLLDPSYFTNASQSVLTEVNQRIQECTLEAADCYNELMDFSQSVKYSKALRKSNPDNIKAIYLLGIGLVRVGDLEQAHAVLHEAKRKSPSATDNVYLNLIDKELEKLDQIIDSKTKTQKSGVVDDNYVVLVHDKVGSVHDGEEKHHKQTEKKTSGSSAAEYFLGSLVSTSAISFVVGKYLLKYPTRKGVISSLIVGVVVGGVSLVIQSAMKNKNETDVKKKK